MEAQHQELAEQEQKLQETLTQLQQRVSRFRSQKEGWHGRRACQSARQDRHYADQGRRHGRTSAVRRA